MTNEISPSHLGQGSKRSLRDQTINPENLSLQDAKQMIHELQIQNAALLTNQFQLENEQRTIPDESADILIRDAMVKTVLVWASIPLTDQLLTATPLTFDL